MTKPTFTSSEQAARDMKLGTFPEMSEDTKRELAERSRVFEIAVASLKVGAPGLSELSREAIARNIAMKVVATPEYNGGDTPPI